MIVRIFPVGWEEAVYIICGWSYRERLRPVDFKGAQSTPEGSAFVIVIHEDASRASGRSRSIVLASVSEGLAMTLRSAVASSADGGEMRQARLSFLLSRSTPGSNPIVGRLARSISARLAEDPFFELPFDYRRYLLLYD